MNFQYATALTPQKVLFPRGAVPQYVIPTKFAYGGREPGSRKIPIILNCHWIPDLARLAWIFHELLSRDHEDGRATWQPQGVGSEAYLNGTSQVPTPEDARKNGHIRGRSRRCMKYPG